MGVKIMTGRTYKPRYLEDYIGYSIVFDGYFPEENEDILARVGLSFSATMDDNIKTLEDVYFSNTGNLYYTLYPNIPTIHRTREYLNAYRMIRSDGLYSMINYDSSFCNTLSDISVNYCYRYLNDAVISSYNKNLFEDQIFKSKCYNSTDKISTSSSIPELLQLDMIFSKNMILK